MCFCGNDDLQLVCIRYAILMGPRPPTQDETRPNPRTALNDPQHLMHGTSRNQIWFPYIQLHGRGQHCVRGLQYRVEYVFDYPFACFSCHYTFRVQVIVELEVFSKWFFTDDLEKIISVSSPTIWHSIVMLEWQSVTKRLWEDIGKKEEQVKGTWTSKMSDLHRRASTSPPVYTTDDLVDFPYVEVVDRAERITYNFGVAVSFIRDNLAVLQPLTSLASLEHNNARNQRDERVSKYGDRLLPLLERIVRDNRPTPGSFGSPDPQRPSSRPQTGGNNSNAQYSGWPPQEWGAEAQTFGGGRGTGLGAQFAGLGISGARGPNNSPATSAYSSDQENRSSRRDRRERES
ncbi:hypothetical protein QBC37DRAFT_372143 [Rhypophila decipiens]|uniref:Uncharacterized protein n=1 Tax=Rhypophila decipiens TaxID=261697 RepID=A0AAN6YAB9_9PEZI|nr:hypothetical protein QBC37DRAFT_372143 [Rhypophila decipiens]